MKLWLYLFLAVLLLALIGALAIQRLHPAFATIPQVDAPKTVEEIDEGGPGSVDSSDPQRAAKAIDNLTPRLTAELAARGLRIGAPIYIRIFKESYELEFWVQGAGGAFERFRTYRISALSGVLGPKKKEGDYQSPEGFYRVVTGRFNPRSSYHLAFDIGYPNKFDRQLGRTGSLIMVHGKSVSIGCYAMTDASIEEIYTLAHWALEGSQTEFRVDIYPFRMSDERLAEAKGSDHEEFWRNLREGHDRFEASRVPPDVDVRAGRYFFF